MFQSDQFAYQCVVVCTGASGILCIASSSLLRYLRQIKQFALIADPTDRCSLLVCFSVGSRVTKPFLAILSGASCSLWPCLGIFRTDRADAFRIIHFLSRLTQSLSLNFRIAKSSLPIDCPRASRSFSSFKVQEVLALLIVFIDQGQILVEEMTNFGSVDLLVDHISEIILEVGHVLHLVW
jgi:hypothetical protein